MTLHDVICMVGPVRMKWRRGLWQVATRDGSRSAYAPTLDAACGRLTSGG